jgi:hypothetical protein
LKAQACSVLGERIRTFKENACDLFMADELEASYSRSWWLPAGRRFERDVATMIHLVDSEPQHLRLA